MGARREKLAIAITALIGILSVVTGLVSLSYQPEIVPIVGLVPSWLRTVVSLTGAFTGFAMLLSAWGLKHRLRFGWYSSLAFLPVTALQGLAQSNVLSVPLVVLSLAGIPTVASQRSAFSRNITLTQGQWAAVGALVSALLYGTVGSYALRDGFGGIQTPIDAFYYTVVTISTVGYGDTTPDTQLARAFAVSFIVVGTAAFAFALGTLVTPLIESRLSKALGRVTELQLEALEDHIIVLGYDSPSEPVVEELSGRSDFVIITPDSQEATRLRERGHMVVNANPSDEKALERARLGAASAVVAATNDDAEDALAVLTARQLNPDVRVVVSVAEEENIAKLRRAGADTVVSPASIVGDLLVESALTGEDTGSVADEVMDEEFPEEPAKDTGMEESGSDEAEKPDRKTETE